jgi:hypothetical protein
MRARRIRSVIAAMVGAGLIFVGGMALAGSGPSAVALSGSFSLNDKHPSAPTSCGPWSEITAPERYHGISQGNDPLIDGRRMVLNLSYTGGGSGAGIMFGTMQLFDKVHPAVLLAHGAFSATTDGFVPPHTAVGYATLEVVGKPGAKALMELSFNMGSDGTKFQGDFDGGPGVRSVLWNGATCNGA